VTDIDTARLRALYEAATDKRVKAVRP